MTVMNVTITLNDARFEGLALSAGEKIAMIETMIDEGTYDLRDAHISALEVKADDNTP